MQPVSFAEKDLVPADRCPLCGSAHRTAAYSIASGTSIFLCDECGLHYAGKQLVGDGLAYFWANYLQDDHRADEVMLDLRQRMYSLDYSYIARFLAPGSSILDVGCADGLFLDCFNQDGHSCYGVEFGASAASAAAEKYTVWEGVLPELDIPITFDLIIFRGVLQYFLNPRAYLKKAVELLRDRGLIFVTAQPNMDSLCHKVYRDKFTLGPNEFTYAGYTPAIIDAELTRLGCHLVGEKFFYEETPYAAPEKDIEEVLSAISRKRQGLEIITTAPAFWGNMMTLVFQKNAETCLQMSHV